ncbi:MAG TPA: signal peptide peptidase SppA [Streptosporangiaceae bacterium]|nr:signal peptide peptidase SppA [Streptosporangiaceae bacterium]
MAAIGVSNSISKLTRQRTAPLILELDLTDGIAEARPTDPVSAMMTRHQPTVADVVAGLRLARDDDRVKALVVKVGGKPIGLGTVQELREAVARFAASGKPTVAWAETFGEFSAGNVPYYLATAFGTICLQPSGDLGLTGLAVEQVFLRGALDKLGVRMEIGARHEYKSAAERFTERGFSGPAREATQRMAESVTGQLADAIAERGKISTQEATRLINEGPYLAEQAVAAGLVDTLGYRDEVYASLRGRVNAVAEPMLLYLGRYQRSKELASRARQLAAPRPHAVALIHATGTIRRGRGGRSPMTGTAMGSDSITAALRSAAADPHIRAIVLRVNSPGGSYVASDSIWHEVVRARNAGKPVVVSMGDVAASGGYFISMAADAIVAQPGTVTGSIGVISGKPVLGEMLDKAGVTTDSVVVGEHAAMFSTARPFTEAEWAVVDAWLDHIYADFTGKVAAGRGLSAQRVHDLARGRVWTGADARERDLVDELGGIEEAADIARHRAGLPPTAPLVPYPRIGPLERIRPASNSEDRRAAAGIGPVTGWPAAQLAGRGIAAAAAAVGAGLAGSPGAAAVASALGEGLLGEGLLAESWGPVWQLAARCGLSAHGPLLLPGSWTFH